MYCWLRAASQVTSRTLCHGSCNSTSRFMSKYCSPSCTLLLPANVKHVSQAAVWQVKAVMRFGCGVDSRFSLLVMGFCNPTCASFSDNVFTAAEDACMLQVHMLVSCYKVSANRKLCKSLAAFNSRQRSELLYQSKANCLYTQHMLHVVQLTC